MVAELPANASYGCLLRPLALAPRLHRPQRCAVGAAAASRVRSAVLPWLEPALSAAGCVPWCYSASLLATKRMAVVLATFMVQRLEVTGPSCA